MDLPYERGDSPASSESSYDPAFALMNEIDHPQPPLSQSKRRISDVSSSDEQSTRKRARTDSVEAVHLDSQASRGSGYTDRSRQLSPEIWHHIFTFLPPRSLGNLLRVNRLFHSYLHPSLTVSPQIHHPTLLPSSTTPGSMLVPLYKPDNIWQASRRLFWPRMPAPLKSHTELDMWRLVCSSRCQFCDTWESRAAEASSIKDQWHRGPGAKGVSPIFSFSVVCCASCLESRSLKEAEVLLDKTVPLGLLHGLPAIYLTRDMNVVAPQTLKTEKVSTNGQPSKVYWLEQIEVIRKELEAVRALGFAAAEEWLKGLEDRGKSALADAARWEKWELQGGLRQARLTDTQPRGGSGTTTPKRQDFGPRMGQTRMDGLFTAMTRQAETTKNPSTPERRQNDTNGTQFLPQVQQQHTAEEVAGLKQKRKSEIERRAGLLEPPLTAAVLAHMPSFQAALQIPKPLDNTAWKLLQPRLLAQRSEAEKRDRDSQVITGIAEATQTKSDTLARSRRDPREVPDKEWDDIQGPVRLKISNYADEIIKDGWQGGSKLNKKNVCQFVAEVLVYVRKRFYAEVAKDAAATIAAGKDPVADPPEGPWTQKLTLENMKWVFDIKVRPRAEKHKKELFFCNGCPGQNKPFGFEGVLQHYAAKHTDSLSIANVVLFWRAEWPDIPPFTPDGKQPSKQPKSKAAPVPGPAHVPHAAPDLDLPVPGQVAATAPAQTAASVSQPVAASVPQPVAASVPQPVAASAPATIRVAMNGTASRQQPPQYMKQLDYMASVTKETWDCIKHIESVPSCVKICVIIHHIAKSFQEKFSKAAPLQLFMDGVQTRKCMRPIRSTAGLQCKTCMENMMGPIRRFQLPKLAEHFSKMHVDNQERPWDWRTQMVGLPELEVLRSLPVRLAYDKVAYATVADALPWAFNGQLDERRDVAPIPASGPLHGSALVPYEKPTSPLMARTVTYHSHEIASHPHWPQPPQEDSSRPRYQYPVSSQVKSEYEYVYHEVPPTAPVEEYELLEVRDPHQGTYYIRRPIRRENFAYNPRAAHTGYEQQRPVYDEYNRRLAAPPSTNSKVAAMEEDYDPRFPAGDVPRY